MRPDDVIPFAMKRSTAKVDPLHLVVRDSSASGIRAAIQSTADGQAFGRRRRGDEIDDGFVIPQLGAPPVRGDEREEAMLDLVPFTGPGRCTRVQTMTSCRSVGCRGQPGTPLPYWLLRGIRAIPTRRMTRGKRSRGW